MLALHHAHHLRAPFFHRLAFRESGGRVFYGDAADVVVPFSVDTVEALSSRL